MFLMSRSLTIPGGASGGRFLFKVREICAARACAALAARLRPPKAIVREAVREVAKADFWSELRRQPSETIGSAPRRRGKRF